MAAALLLLVCTAGFARQETPRPHAPRQDSFDDLYQRGQRANAAIKTLTAQFTEITTSSLLTRPLVSRGTARRRTAVDAWCCATREPEARWSSSTATG